MSHALQGGLLLLLCGAAFGGELTPPVGPVAPTHKTLTEVEPRTAVNAANTPGDADALFVISSPGSYYLTGNIQGERLKHGIKITASGVTLDLMGFDVLGAAESLNGIHAPDFAARNITVRNGTVRFWGGEGVNVFGTYCVFERILSHGNGGGGFIGDNGTAYSECTASENGSFGIAAGAGCVVTRCAAHNNASTGISLNLGTVTECLTFSNDADGIKVSGGRVASCVSLFNLGDGIEVTDASTITGNTCVANGFVAADGAGIHVIGTDNRVEGNQVSGNDRGVDVDAAGNLMVGNTASNNTTAYAIVAGNRYGPIIDISAGGTAAVNGAAAAGNLGTADPWTNFTH